MYHFDFDQNIVGLSGFKGLLLMVTVKNGCVEAIMQLVEDCDAEVKLIDEHGQNALEVGLALATEFIRCHVSSDNLHSATSAPETTMPLLTWAVINGHVEVLRLLIAYGANITEKNYEGMTNLKHALEQEHEEIARLLLANGANFDIEAVPEGKALLHVAASNVSEMEVRLLLEQGLEVDATDEEQLTSLHWAAWNGHGKVAQLLIQSGANLDAKSDMGNTALHLVMSNKDYTGPGDGDMVRWLLAKDSQINATDNRKWTPLHLAASNGYSKIVDILLEHGPDFESGMPSFPTHR
jgi:ankyrin repeat protein